MKCAVLGVLTMGVGSAPACALALPAIERTAVFSIPDPQGNGGSQIVVYQDYEDKNTVWWFPYSAERATSLGQLQAMARWFANETPARMQFALEFVPFRNDTILALHSEISRGLRIAPESLRVKPLSLRNIQLLSTDQDFVGRFLLATDSKPATSFFPWILSVTVALSPEENEQLKLYASAGPLPVSLNVIGRFKGVKGPGTYAREYKGACVAERVRQGRSDEELAGLTWSSRKFYSIRYSIELGCVTKTAIFGSARSMTERLADWDDELIRRGVVSREPDGTIALTGVAPPDELRLQRLVIHR